jgi:hypothetical protein
MGDRSVGCDGLCLRPKHGYATMMNDDIWNRTPRRSARFGGGTPRELQRLNLFANRGDSLAVASVAYRMRRLAERNQLVVLQEGAARIEESARRNNIAQFTSEIQLLDHQVRWYSQTAKQPF